MDVSELGYSSLCFAEGVSSSGTVLTCDTDAKAVAMAARYHELSEFGNKITRKVSKASAVLDESYRSGLIFDLVFVDADKKVYLEYVKRLIDDDGSEGRSLIRDGGLIVVDNTLWKGLVLHNVSYCMLYYTWRAVFDMFIPRSLI
jgi:caffeoyl-CoA O-methyltransferase